MVFLWSDRSKLTRILHHLVCAAYDIVAKVVPLISRASLVVAIALNLSWRFLCRGQGWIMAARHSSRGSRLARSGFTSVGPKFQGSAAAVTHSNKSQELRKERLSKRAAGPTPLRARREYGRKVCAGVCVVWPPVWLF